MIGGIAQVKIVLRSRGKFPDSSGFQPVVSVRRDDRSYPTDIPERSDALFVATGNAALLTIGLFGVPKPRAGSPCYDRYCAWPKIWTHPRDIRGHLGIYSELSRFYFYGSADGFRVVDVELIAAVGDPQWAP